MLITNLDFVPGKDVEILGLVFGVGVPPFKMRWTAEGMGKVIEEGVDFANKSMIEKAEQLGADVIIKVFYDKESSESGVRIMVWGTAVRLKTARHS